MMTAQFSGYYCLISVILIRTSSSSPEAAAIISAKSSICDNVTLTERDVFRLIFATDEQRQHWVRPVRNARKPIDVSFRLVLSSLVEVIEKEKIVKFNGYLSMKWNDEIHVWNNVFPYACLEVLVIPSAEVWTPEVASINSDSHYSLTMSRDERIRMYSNGSVSFRPGGTFSIYCDFNLRNFPFDHQICRIQLESWRYTHDYQTLSIGDPPVSFKYWIENDQWILNGFNYRIANVNYLAAENSYDHLEFEIRLKRKVGHYTVNVIAPSIIISVAQLSVFSLPVEEVMKIHISFTCLLAYGVFQLMVIEDLPRSSDNIPLLSIYIELSMAYIATSMLLEALVFVCLRIADNKRRRILKLPKCLLSFACCTAAVLRIEPPPAMKTDKKKNNFNEPCKQFSQIWLDYANKIAYSSSLDNNSNETSSNHQQQHNGGTISIIKSSANKNSNNRHVETSFSSSSTIISNNDDNDERVIITDDKTNWIFVAIVIDRATFVIYLLLIVTTAIGMFVVLPALCS